MEKRIFRFCIEPQDRSAYCGELARALEKRTEMLSREKYPGMWKVTDFSADYAQKGSPQRHTKLRGAVFLAVGIFLALTALMAEQRLWALLIGGIAASVWGLVLLFYKKEKQSSRRFLNAAQTLLQNTALKDGTSAEVLFDEDAMTMKTGNEEEKIAYPKFECAVETENLYLICADERALVLEKSRIACGENKDFKEFLGTKTSFYTL